jgi:predicted transcriptional regulator
MKTTTIRVTAATRDRLNALARRRGTPAGQLVEELVREADDEALLASAAEAWEAMASAPDALGVYRAETRELEGFGARLPDD